MMQGERESCDDLCPRLCWDYLMQSAYQGSDAMHRQQASDIRHPGDSDREMDGQASSALRLHWL